MYVRQFPTIIPRNNTYQLKKKKKKKKKKKCQSALIRNPEKVLKYAYAYILVMGVQLPTSTVSPCTRCSTTELVAL